MRFLCRLLSLFALSVAVIMGVVDATRTIAATEWVFTPLGESWRGAFPASFAAMQEAILGSALPALWDRVMLFVLALPGWLVFAILALLFYAAGQRRRRPGEMFAETW